MNYKTLCSFPLVLFCISLAKEVSTAEISPSSVKNFQDAVKAIRDDVMGASKFQKHIDDLVKLERVPLDGRKIALDVANSLSKTFKSRRVVLKRLSDAIVKSLSAENNFKDARECCNISRQGNKYDSRFQTIVDTKEECNILAPTAPEVKKSAGNEFLEAAVENLKAYPGLRWQYFGSEEGVLRRFPSTPAGSCKTTYDNRYRPWYVQATAPKPKDVVVVIDRSGSMEDFGKMESAKNAAITVLSTLTPDDRATVITFSTEAYAIGTSISARAVSSRQFFDAGHKEYRNTSCFRHTLASATPMNIRRMVSVVNMTIPYGETNYSKALALAFDFLKESYLRDLKSHESLHGNNKMEDITKTRDRVILFLSDGEPSDSPKRIFTLIRDRNLELHNSVIMLCFALGSGTFGSVLKLMAAQNFAKASGTIPAPTPGFFRHVVDVRHLRFAMGSYYNFFAKHQDKHNSVFDDFPVMWSVPYFDAFGLGMVLTAASPVQVNNELRGVVGVDITMHELFADVTYFRVAAHTTYAFLVDTSGRVLMHPFLPAPVAVHDDPVITGIDALERTEAVRRFVKNTLHSVNLGKGPSGRPSRHSDVFTGVFRTVRVLPVDHRGVNAHNATLTYSCVSVNGTRFVLCVVVEANVTSITSLGPQPEPNDFSFLYHRFDLLTPPDLCRHQNNAVTENRSAVMFAPPSFVDSGGYSELPETVSLVNGYHHFMTTGKYASPSSPRFRAGVRSAVQITWVLERLWLGSGLNLTSARMRHITDHVTWRYFGTEQGTMRIFPGCKLPKLYNPVHRPWYELGNSLITEAFVSNLRKNSTATSLHDSVLAAISPPYLDANGEGLIITVSRGITEPPPNGQQSFSERPPHVFGVMGADIFLGFFETLLKDMVSECNDSYKTCMVLDTSGFVIYDRRLSAHESLAVQYAANGGYHVTHANPHVAWTLIRERILVRRKCTDLASVTYKVGHKIDVNRLREVAASLPFDIAHVTGTNVVLLVIPLAYWDVATRCVLHKTEQERCHSTRAASCESPCVDMYGATRHYDNCLNLYNHTWTSDPPPCFPDKFNAMEASDTSAAELTTVIKPDLLKQTDIDPQSLPICQNEIANGYILPSRIHHTNVVNEIHLQPPPAGEMAPKQKFIIYVVCVVVLLAAVNLGLNKRRLRKLCNKEESDARPKETVDEEEEEEADLPEDAETRQFVTSQRM